MNFYNGYKENGNWNFSYFKFFIGLTVGNWENFGKIHFKFLFLEKGEILGKKNLKLCT